MKTELDLYLQKLDYLQDRLIEFDGEENKSQREYLLSEIDQQKTELLKLEVETYFEEIENDPTQTFISSSSDGEGDDEEETIQEYR